MAGGTIEEKTIHELFTSMEYGPVAESAALAEAWLKNKSFGPFIDGVWKDYTQEVAGDGREIFDPCTRKPLATIYNSTAEDIEKGVSSSTSSFKTWSSLSGYERSKHLYSIARNLQKNISLLVQMEALCRGVQTSDPREFDVPVAVRQFYYYAGWAQLLPEELTEWEPFGIVLAVNSSCCPLAALSWMIAPALAAGNTVILRPSSQCPLPAMLFAHICTQAGLPPGVLNVLPGGSKVGQDLVLHSSIKKVSFFGRTNVARQIMQETAHFPFKKFNFLLSGKTTMIVFDTADVDSAVDKVVSASWFNQGQVPWSVTTLLVQESIFEKFVHKLKDRISRVKVGCAFDKLAEIGQPFSSSVVSNVNEAVAEAKRKQLEVYQVDLPNHLSPSLFFQPTLIVDGVTENNRTVSEDDIVPVVSVRPFRTAKEAITLTNNTRYGIAASVWSENATLALEVANQVQVGTVWINSHGIFDASIPFGGWKQSGLGYFSGKRGLLENLKPKGTIQPNGINMEFKLFGTSSDSQDSVPPTILPTNQENQAVDSTYKLFYGGGYKRPDSNASRTVYKLMGKREPFTSVPDGGRKDVRNAVEAAMKAQPGWWKMGAHSRAQILYNMAEKFQARKQDFIRHLQSYSGCSTETATIEVDQTLETLFYWSACCDKHSLTSAQVPINNSFSVVTSYEPVGVMGVVVCEKTGLGLLSFIGLVAPAICYGNAAIAIPDEQSPTAALELCQVFSGCDLPGGVVNVLTGDTKVLVSTLAQHQDVKGLWTTGDNEVASYISWASGQNMKRIWAENRQNIKKTSRREIFEYHSTESKAIWIATGEIFAN